MKEPQSEDQRGLLPAEKIALTVALAQIKRGEHPQPNTASMCVPALARLQGLYDWTEESGSLDHRSVEAT